MKTSLTKTVPLAAALLVVAVSSCSVKEVRLECPCIVEVKLNDVYEEHVPQNMLDGSVAVFIRDGEEILVDDNILLADRPLSRYESTRRGEFDFGALLSLHYAEYMDFDKGRYTIPYGCQADSIYGWHTPIDCTGDTAVVVPVMHKQFTTVTFIDVSGAYFDRMRLEVHGTVSGLDAVSLEPVEGNFFHVIDPQAEGGLTRFRMPRQASDDIRLTVIDTKNTNVNYKLDLGRMISGTGYDFYAEDLKDVYVRLDFIRGTVTLTVEDWAEEWVYSIQ